jgi:hypothetical protein
VEASSRRRGNPPTRSRAIQKQRPIHASPAWQSRPQSTPLIHRRPRSMSPVPSKLSPSAEHQTSSRKRALRAMKEKRVLSAGILPSSATAPVSNATRAEGRAVVLNPLTQTLIGGTNLWLS